MLNGKMSGIIAQVKESQNGSKIEQSRALAEALKTSSEQKVEPKVEKPKAEKKKAKVELTIKVEEDKRTPYQKRLYLSPSYASSDYENKLRDVIAKRTLFIDDNKKFQIWNSATAQSLIKSWIESDKELKSFTTRDLIEKFHIFGGGIGDVSRHALKALEKQGLIKIGLAQNGKRKRYLYEVLRS